MWIAASTSRHLAVAVATFLACAFFAAAAQAQTREVRTHSQAVQLPAEVWGVSFSHADAKDVTVATLQAIKRQGINTVVLLRNRLTPGDATRLLVRAREAGLSVGLVGAQRVCGRGSSECVAAIPSVAASPHNNFAAVHADGIAAAARDVSAAHSGRLLVLVNLPAKVDIVEWRSVVALAKRRSNADLVVQTGAERSVGSSPFRAYLRLLSPPKRPAGIEPPAATGGSAAAPSGGATEGPSAPPAQTAGVGSPSVGVVPQPVVAGAGTPAPALPAPTPTGLIAAPTSNSIVLSWNVAAAGATYAVYINGTQLAGTTTTTYTFGNLGCSTSYVVGVSTSAGASTSSVATVTATTNACAPVSAPPPPPSSSSPPPTKVYVASGGSDAAPCTAAAPCASFDRAYHVATPGQIVEVAGGNYPVQAVHADSSKSGSAVVTFQPAAGATVQIAAGANPWDYGLIVEASHVAFHNLNIGDGWEVDNGADDVTFDGMHAERFRIGSASNVLVKGGDYGPYYDSAGAGGSHVWADSATAADPTNITIDGISMHDYTIPAGSGFHLDCLTIGGGTNVVLENSRFWNCNGFDAWTKPFPKAYGTNGLTFQNNFFGHNLGGTPFEVSFACADAGSSLSNIVFQYNSVDGNAAYGTVPAPCTLSGNGVLFRANILQQISVPNCTHLGAGFTSVHNVVASNPCGATDLVAPPGFVGGGDLHLAPGAAAIGQGDPSSFPSTDIDGDPRPATPDAGADQH